MSAASSAKPSPSNAPCRECGPTSSHSSPELRVNPADASGWHRSLLLSRGALHPDGRCVAARRAAWRDPEQGLAMIIVTIPSMAGGPVIEMSDVFGCPIRRFCMWALGLCLSSLHLRPFKAQGKQVEPANARFVKY